MSKVEKNVKITSENCRYKIETVKITWHMLNTTSSHVNITAPNIQWYVLMYVYLPVAVCAIADIAC